MNIYKVLDRGNYILNIAIATLTNIDLTNACQYLNPVITMVSSRDDELMKLAEISLQLDEIIYFGNHKIDLVFVINHDDIDFNLLKSMVENGLHSNNTVYFIKNTSMKSFFCSPSVSSLLGNAYKLNPTDYSNSFYNIKCNEFSDKILFAIDRMGIDINVISI